MLLSAKRKNGSTNSDIFFVLMHTGGFNHDKKNAWTIPFDRTKSVRAAST